MALVNQTFSGWVMDTLKRRGRVVIRCQGRSMQPAIPDGASLEVRPVAFDELRIGDIVVFHYGGDVFCHRLIKKIGRRCILKGDTLLYADPPVLRDQIIGRVTTLIPEGSRLIPLDTPRQRCLAVLLARATYPYALLFAAHRRLSRLLAWNRGVYLPGD
jgi:hypothetical protein